jgi:sigma-B regulation protein RsbU (phosphoserine phosphatase)
MQRVQEGAIHVRYTPDWMGFEINALGRQFNETLDTLLLQMQEAEKERVAREKLREELRIGHEIQASLLPAHIPEIKELNIGAGYLPALEVSGDFYDLFLLENGSLFLAMADTAGKGISGCLYSLGLRSALRSFAAVSTDLSEIVLRANDLFWVDVKNTGMFVTLWAGIYHPKTRLLTYCNQGHTPACLMRGDHLQELTTPGIALGAQKFTAVMVESVTLQLQDLLFLYTDGVIEAHNSDQQLFGLPRLRALLSRTHAKAPSLIIDQLLEELRLFSGPVAQHDDITALAVRILK